MCSNQVGLVYTLVLSIWLQQTVAKDTGVLICHRLLRSVLYSNIVMTIAYMLVWKATKLHYAF